MWMCDTRGLIILWIYNVLNLNTTKKFKKILIQHGLIYNDGEPKRCWCGSKNFTEYNFDYLNYGTVLEYSVKCADCDRDLANWAYGGWVY